MHHSRAGEVIGAALLQDSAFSDNCQEKMGGSHVAQYSLI